MVSNERSHFLLPEVCVLTSRSRLRANVIGSIIHCSAEIMLPLKLRGSCPDEAPSNDVTENAKSSNAGAAVPLPDRALKLMVPEPAKLVALSSVTLSE